MIEIVNSYENRERARNTRVWLNGKEVTQDTFEASLFKLPFIPFPGYVKRYLRDENGNRYVLDRERWGVAFETKYGLVRWC